MPQNRQRSKGLKLNKKTLAKKETSPIREITIDDLKANEEVTEYLNRANQFTGKLGYTEHGIRHASLVGHIATNILKNINGVPEREIELAGIAGYLHDIGNFIARDMHGITSALIARSILKEMGMPFEEISLIMNAICNHDEDYGYPASRLSAAVMLADKADVHRSRVRNENYDRLDIHDRVNYAAKKSFLKVDRGNKIISLEIEIDTEISQVMEYFEIFLSRMVMSRKAAEFLGTRFRLVINNNVLL